MAVLFEHRGLVDVVVDGQAVFVGVLGDLSNILEITHFFATRTLAAPGR